MPDDHSNGTQGECCGSCENSERQQPRFVVGVFTDAAGANGAAERLRVGAAGKVNVLSSAGPMLENDLGALPGLGCGRLFEQIARHLESGASIVIVDVQSPEHQLGVSRVLLESKCDLLVTHDGTRHAD